MSTINNDYYCRRFPTIHVFINYLARAHTLARREKARLWQGGRVRMIHINAYQKIADWSMCCHLLLVNYKYERASPVCGYPWSSTVCAKDLCKITVNRFKSADVQYSCYGRMINISSFN